MTFTVHNPQMSTLTYDQLFETILGISVALIVLSALWIVVILISIEANKAAYFYTVNASLQHSLEMNEEENGMEVEPSSKPSSPTSVTANKKRPRPVKASFKLMQLGSVSVLLLLTYLLLVVSEAPLWASAVGSLCVFGIFMRFQIGDELRRHRIDRIALMMSLFLLIASLMSVCTYAFKSLANGEIYEGPARIVGYDQSNYNNTDHDPSTRTDLEVQWGKEWGCPLSGGKVCQATVQGAMCTVNLDPEETTQNNNNGERRRRQRRRQRRRFLQDPATQGDADALAGENSTSTMTEEELEQPNAELEAKNEELEKEVEELELENKEEEEVAEEEVEEVKDEEQEDEAIYDEDIETVEGEELEIEEEYTDAYIDVEEEEVEVEEKYAMDPETVEEDEEKVEELEDEKEDIDEVLNDYEDEYQDNADAYGEQAEQFEDAEAAVEEEEVETKEEYKEAEEAIENGTASESQEAVVSEEAEETEEEIMDEEYWGTDDGWYWEEITYDYDDDMFDSEYWTYDWDSAWGEYACEDLFDEDMMGLTYDMSTPAGEDDYPYINIYGSCKTCEAYILDTFAEEAFESVECHKRLAFTYMSAAMVGFAFSFVSFIKYKVSPAQENEIELLGRDGGVMA